jgi:hypothetical protein
MTRLALFLLLALVACAPQPCRTGKPMVETQLYFGLSKKDGTVSAKEWQHFVDTEIAPRFPEGFTVIDGHGAWLSRETNRAISENSRIVIRLHEATEEEDAAITAITAHYKRLFMQEAILRTDMPVCAAF